MNPQAGGPSRTVVQLADALANQAGINVTLLSQQLVGDRVMASASAGVNRHVVKTHSHLALKLGLPVRDDLEIMAQASPPQLFHSHGIWLPVNYWTARAARRQGVPLIIQPRGMLEPWALNHRAWKKKIATLLYQRRDLQAARLFVATAESEYESIRQTGARQPVAVIANGVDFPDVPVDTVSRAEAAPRTALFLSRVHPKKGLLNLLQAWGRVAPMGWRLKIAGPDEGGHLREVMNLARQLGIAKSIEYVGEKDGAAKSKLFTEADFFVLPTFSENFGVVVAEALAHGLPVITTRGAPWADLLTHGCGWWVDLGVDALVQALREAIALSDAERHAMGARGRVYVQQYNWDEIARQTIDVYRWALGHGPQPHCVRAD
ncbi:MAG: glycosyltransferase [Aeromicrobium sp.]|nr:glycosyltransferase [Burkholderiales bacterium]